MTRVVFVLEAFGGDGPTRSLVALGEAVSGIDPTVELHVVTLSEPAYPFTVMQARRAGLILHLNPSASELDTVVEQADVVVPLYWNSPAITQFVVGLRQPIRLVPWLQINGFHAPQRLPLHLIERSDTIICTAEATMTLPELAGSRVAHVPALPNLGRLDGARPADTDPFTVTYLGTINGAKMHPAFVSMSSLIDVPGVRILIHGAGGGEGLLAEQIEASSDPHRFELGGFVENVGAVLAASHVFGYPLKRETYATTEKSLIEAMAAGVCPVVFGHGGVNEIVVHQSNGLVVDDETSYAAAVRWLFEHADERERMASAAQLTIRQRFDPQRLARRFLDVVIDALSRPRSEPNTTPDLGSTADRFIQSLGLAGELLNRSQSNVSAIAANADREIASRHDHLGRAEGGIVQYRNTDPSDPWLRWWTGLVLAGDGRQADAQREFEAAKHIDPSMNERANPAMHVKQREHAFAMEADDDLVVVDRSGSKMLTLNRVGGLLWNHLEEPASPDDLTAVLVDRWPDLDPAQLRADVDVFLAEAIESGIVVIAD